MDETPKFKKKPKGPIKFQITLNEEQKEAKSIILNNHITVLHGKAGSGKTLLAAQIALDLLFTKQVEKIIITRPTVSKEDIGFLPGDLKEKLDPWVAPVYANFYLLYDRVKIDQLIEQNTIEIVPVSFMRGRTFLNSVVIADECQNLTHSQTQMVLSRLGIGSKMMVCGDIDQIDLRRRSDSGFSFLCSLEQKVKGLASVKLLKNHRHEIVGELLDIYEKSNKDIPQS